MPNSYCALVWQNGRLIRENFPCREETIVTENPRYLIISSRGDWVIGDKLFTTNMPGSYATNRKDRFWLSATGDIGVWISGIEPVIDGRFMVAIDRNSIYYGAAGNKVSSLLKTLVLRKDTIRRYVREYLVDLIQRCPFPTGIDRKSDRFSKLARMC